MVKLYVEGGGDTAALKTACRKGFTTFITKASYGKGEHSFKLLEKIDPAKISAASPWAKRFVDELKKKMDS